MQAYATHIYPPPLVQKIIRTHPQSGGYGYELRSPGPAPPAYPPIQGQAEKTAPSGGGG